MECLINLIGGNLNVFSRFKFFCQRSRFYSMVLDGFSRFKLFAKDLSALR